MKYVRFFEQITEDSKLENREDDRRNIRQKKDGKLKSEGKAQEKIKR